MLSLVQQPSSGDGDLWLPQQREDNFQRGLENMRIAPDPLRKVLDRGNILAMGTVAMMRIRSMAQGVIVPHCIMLNKVEGLSHESTAAHTVERAQLFGSRPPQSMWWTASTPLRTSSSVPCSQTTPLRSAKGWGRTRRLPLVSPLKVFWTLTLREGFLLASPLKGVEGFSCPKASES